MSVEDPGKRKHEVSKVLWITLFLNLLVALFKLGYGEITNTLSMIADGYHSLLDGSSNIIGLIALAFAVKPADYNHPYGHRKVEAVAAMAISGLLFLACYEIASGAYHRFYNQQIPTVTFWSFLIMIGTMMINYGVSVYEHRKGIEHHSQILTADSAHTRSDVFASLSVIVALIGAKFNLGYLDLAAAGFIAIFVGYSGYKIVYESLTTLMDTAQLDPKEIEKIALQVEGVQKCHHIRTRGHSSAIYMDLNIHVDSKLNLERAHELTHEVIHRIKAKLPEVVDVVVHTEPANDYHE